MNEPEQEYALIQSVKWLQTLNDSPGRHIVTFPVNPDARWKYEWEPFNAEATQDPLEPWVTLTIERGLLEDFLGAGFTTSQPNVLSDVQERFAKALRGQYHGA